MKVGFAAFYAEANRVRLVDEFEIDTVPGVGTTVRLVKWTRF